MHAVTTVTPPLLYRLGLAASFASILCSVHTVSLAQTGPGWEIPVTNVPLLTTIPLVALLLSAVAPVVYLAAYRSGGLSPGEQALFWILWALALTAALITWALAPGRLSVDNKALAFLLRTLPLAAWAGSLFVFWWVGLRLLKRTVRHKSAGEFKR